ncbi:MAG TPA: DNA-3-methyladenine glycosylase 2 family protein [Acidimicrobiales bacterium]|nr:DNA-3-methyladenine glycosylase 2 family protein [Acidimicrobiales bacterium]
MIEDFDRCYSAVQSKDPRFDGWFFTAVTSTGIYCRPSCPAQTPKAANVRFYPTAAAAQQAGFRACKRCRPDAAPGSPEWDARADVVARAMRLIADGVVDRDGVPGLAARLAYSTRQLERLLRAEVGAGPVALARSQRAQTARILIETTDLPMSALAFAAGFSSIRQFNDTVREVFAGSPSDLRSKAAGRARTLARNAGRSSQRIDLRLPFRSPFWPNHLFGHLAATAVPGCEEIRDGAYRRVLDLPRGPATVTLSPRPDHIACRLWLDDLRDLTTAIARCRRLLDLDADPQAVDAALARDEKLAPLTAKTPGQRVPRSVDESEMALRSVLGQQVSTAAARTHAGRLVAGYGTPVTDPEDGGLTHTFPPAARLAEVDPNALAMPEARRRSFLSLARALADGTLQLGPGADRTQARGRLGELPGLGPWTIEIIAMRALGDPDAFPVGDLGVRKAAAPAGLPDRVPALLSRAEAWRPWRAYATQYLWSSLDHPINRWPPSRTPAGAHPYPTDNQEVA